MLKSIREARLRTNWNVPRSKYEEETSRFVTIAFESSEFLASFRQFEAVIGPAAAQNGLIETVLKLTVPGVPDFYQGAEFWEQSMVDPDNRRPVDFSARWAALNEGAPLGDLIAAWRDGRIKQQVVAKLLRLRAEKPDLFSSGSYEPLDVGNKFCAFERRNKESRLLVAVRLLPWAGERWSGLILERCTGLADLFNPAGPHDHASAMSSRLPLAVLHSSC